MQIETWTFSNKPPGDPQSQLNWLKANLKPVTTTPRLTLMGVEKDAILRRFLDLPKLFDLLKNRRVVMPSLKSLLEDDPFECSAPKNLEKLERPVLEAWIKRQRHYAPAQARRPIDYLEPYSSTAPAQDLNREVAEMTMEELRQAIWYLERERLKKELMCSCWHMDTTESDAMWKIYAPHLGVFISSSAARMERSFQITAPQLWAERAELRLAAVRYEDTGTCGDTEPWLLKRKAFAHEKEVRLYCEFPFDTVCELQITLPSFIEEIVITPFAKPWQISGIHGAIEALLKEANASSITVRQSKHMRPPEVVWPPDVKARKQAVAMFREATKDFAPDIQLPADYWKKNV